jgi:hypothetical protein
MQANVQIGRRAEAMDWSECAGVGCATFALPLAWSESVR